MFTFTILVITILSLIIAAIVAIVAGGIGFILAFSDLIVCGAIIGLIVWLIFGLRR